MDFASTKPEVEETRSLARSLLKTFSTMYYQNQICLNKA